MDVGGAGHAIIAHRKAVSIAGFSRFDDIIRTDRIAIIVIDAIAPRGAAPVVTGARRDIKVIAHRVAGDSGSVERIGGAIVVVIAGGRAIPIAEFVGFKDLIAAGRTAIVVVGIIAP